MKPLYSAAADIMFDHNAIEAQVPGCPVVFKIATAFDGRLPAETLTPEHFFAMAYGASLASSIDLQGRQMQIELDSIKVNALVSIGHGDDGHFAITVDLRAKIAALDGKMADRLVRKAHESCPYFRMIRPSIRVWLTLHES